MTDIIDTKHFDLKIEDGKVIIQSEYSLEGVTATGSVSVEVGVFAEKLKAAIPGGIDDVVIDGLMAALLPKK